MSDTQKHPTPPYASFSSLINFINRLKETTVPARIDASVFGNASGSLSYSIMATLKSLKLIGADGVPSAEFATFVEADDDTRKIMMIDALQAGYPTLWSNFNLATATAGQFDEHLRESYDVKGSTVDKVAAFFIAAANYAGINLSAHLKARRPTASSSSSRKSSKQRSRPDPDPAEMSPPPPPALPPIPAYHPFVQGLLETLPKTAEFEKWSIDQQAEWLDAAAGIFRVLSKQKGRITISVQGGSDGSSGPGGTAAA